MTSSSHLARARRARARQHGVAPDSRRPHRRSSDQAPLRRALHRHVRVARHPPRHLAGAGHARNDLRLEPRNADAGGARRAADTRTARWLSAAARRRIEGRGLAARVAQGRRENHVDLRAGCDRVRCVGALRNFLHRDFAQEAVDAVAQTVGGLLHCVCRGQHRIRRTMHVGDRGRNLLQHGNHRSRAGRGGGDIFRNLSGRGILLLDRRSASPR